MSTQLPLQSEGAAGGQPEAHEYDPASPTHAGVLPLHAAPQVPQLEEVVNWTQAPLHGVYPASQAYEQAPLTHTGCALAMAVVHAWPHVLQLSASLVVSTQLPLQSVGAADGHPDTHEYAPPAPAHTPVLPVQALPQLPQLAAVVYWTHAPPQRLYPVSHAIAQVPSAQVGCAFATAVVQTLPQVPQLAGPLRSTHSPAQTVNPTGQPPSDVGDNASSPESVSTSPPVPASLPRLLSEPLDPSERAASSEAPSLKGVPPPSGGTIPPSMLSPDAHPVPRTAMATATARRRTTRM